VRAVETARSTLVAFLAALAGGYVGTRLASDERSRMHDHDRAAVAARSSDAAVPLPNMLAPGARFATAPVRATLDAQERAAIVEDVARVIGSCVEVAHPIRGDPAPASREAVQARHDAEGIIDRALASKEWTEDDARALRNLLPKTAAGDRHALMLAVTRALNEGRIVLRGTDPPF
jgi:hypothetical protein